LQEGRGKKVKWGLYMWIYLNCEDLASGVSKALLASVAMEEGFEVEDNKGLVDDVSKKTKKRVRSIGESNAVSDEPGDKDVAEVQKKERSDFLEKISSDVTALVGHPIGNLSGFRSSSHLDAHLEVERDEMRVRVLNSLSSHPHVRIS